MSQEAKGSVTISFTLEELFFFIIFLHAPQSWDCEHKLSLKSIWYVPSTYFSNKRRNESLIFGPFSSDVETSQNKSKYIVNPVTDARLIRWFFKCQRGLGSAKPAWRHFVTHISSGINSLDSFFPGVFLI